MTGPRGIRRDPDQAATVEDLTFLAAHRVGVTEAAHRTGFTGPDALDRWMRRQTRLRGVKATQAVAHQW